MRFASFITIETKFDESIRCQSLQIINNDVFYVSVHGYTEHIKKSIVIGINHHFDLNGDENVSPIVF